MHIERELITPARATELLGLNFPGQRNARRRVENRYANDMVSGDWRETGDTIKLNQAGQVIDGQHRLHAVIQAKVDVWFWVAYGVPNEAFDVLDQGFKRGFDDVVGARGVSSANVVSAAVSSMNSYVQHRGFLANGSTRASMPRLVTLWEANREIERFAPLARSIYRFTQFPKGHMAAMLYVFSLTKTEDVDRFAVDLTTGEGLRSGDPAYAARQMMITRMGTPGTRRYGVDHYCANMVRAWNGFAKGETVSVLKGRVNGKFPDVFDPHGFLDTWVQAMAA